MGAVLAGLPLFLGGIGCWLSGLAVPWLSRGFGNRIARKGLGFVGLGARGIVDPLSISSAIRCSR